MSFSNPDGDIINSELELCGSIAMNDVASQTFDTREQTLHTLCDNTPAVAWQQKGSTSTTKAASYLLRVQAFHQRVYSYCPRISHIPGDQNSMADDCSRLWHLSDTALLAHFDSTYPQKTFDLADQLDAMAQNNATHLTTLGWSSLMAHQRPFSDLQDNIQNLPHKAGRSLSHLKTKGIPAMSSSPPWTLQQRDDAVSRGSHKSCLGHQKFLDEELKSFVDKGQWLVLPYTAVRELPKLQIHPIGVVPQHGRRPRIIVDLTYSGFNQTAVPLHPSKSMQFGRMLPCFLQKIVNADKRHGPVHMLKVDISDGFYRLALRPDDVPLFGIPWPISTGETLIAFPMCLPMGWVSSPPYFFAVTETIADLTNAALQAKAIALPHPLEDACLLYTSPSPRDLSTSRMPSSA